MQSFKAHRIFDESCKVASRLVEMRLDELDAGDVVVKSSYASVNYKDALAATGKGKIITKFPCNGGIDVSGVVVSSGSPRFKAGDEVICHGFGIGVSHDGGFSEYCRVKSEWMLPIPKGLDLFDAAALGVAGYTAAVAIHEAEHNGMKPADGKIAVTGATGGVSSVVIDILANRGYHVVAISGKDAEHDYLKKLGAAEVVSTKGLEMGKRPMEKGLWAHAFDAVGGEPLAWLTRTTRDYGVIAAYGNAAGFALNTTVLPFILRGVKLIGVQSNSPMALREKLWARLATDLRPRFLKEVARTIRIEDLPEAFNGLIESRVRGRNVVKFG